MQRLITHYNLLKYQVIDLICIYSKKIRETLKEQIDQKDKQIKKEMDDKILEYQYVSQQDMKTINEDKKKKIEKFKYLNNYVKENKQVSSVQFNLEKLF